MKPNKPRLGLLFGLASLLCLSLLSFTGSGCKATLESGGAYSPTTTNSSGTLTPAPDMLLFQADSAYNLAYNAINTVFETERNNRVLLWKASPDIKHTLDKLRPEAWAYNQDYLKARKFYTDHPEPGNMTGVNAALGKIQQIAISVQAAIPKGTQ